MDYLVAPFVALIDPKNGTSLQVAQQLESFINNKAKEGWKYVRLETVTTFVTVDNGCFGIGAKPAHAISKQMVVFEK